MSHVLRRSVARCALVLCALTVVSANVALATPPVRVAFITDGPSDEIAQVIRHCKEEIETLTDGEFSVTYPEEIQRSADWTLEGARQAFLAALDDPGVDIVINLGILTTQVSCCVEDLPKPVISPVVIDAALQGFPQDQGTSGRHNLSYVAFEDTLVEELRLLRRVVNFKKIALIDNGNVLGEMPAIAQMTATALAAEGIESVFVAAAPSAATIVERIPEDVDAVYVWPLFQLSPRERDLLIEKLNEKRLPSFSAWLPEDVEAGMLACSASRSQLTRLAKRIALNLQAILIGEEPSSLPVNLDTPYSLAINMDTARRIGAPIRWEVLIEAEIIGDEEARAKLPKRTLAEVVDAAIDTNLSLLAQERAVAAGAQEVDKARAPLLPRLNLSASAVQVNEELAEASFGNQAERTTIASAVLSQLVYSDAARTNLRVQQEVQRGRESELEKLKLDITRDAAVAFLDVLRAETLVEVQRSNLTLTRAHMELAEARLLVGTASQAEVLRWESEIATARSSLVDAIANANSAKVTLNQVLHIPLSEDFEAIPIELSNPDLVTGQQAYVGYIETPVHFRVLLDFIVEEGLAAAPELAQIDATIAAQERLLAAAKRANWSPTVNLEGSYDEVLGRAGAGKDGSPLLDVEQQDSSWSVALVATLPLYSGQERRAERIQSNETLNQLRYERTSLAQQLEQRIRVSTIQARAALANVDLSRQASAAADRNLELVADAYRRGAISIIDLIDAQTVQFNAEQAAANAVFDFLVDLMEVERSVARFGFLVTDEERQQWVARMNAFFANAGLQRMDP